MIAGDNGAHLVALGMRPHNVGDAADRCDDEAVGREHEFGGKALTCCGWRHRNEPPTPLGLEAPRLLGVQRLDHMPRFGRGDQGRGATGQ